MAVQKLTGGTLSPTSMSAGNTISDPHGHELGMALTGSDSVNPIPDRQDNVGLPDIPGDQMPVSNISGHYGGAGLPPSPPSPPPAGPWTVGVQGGGLQGKGNPGAGSSGADVWKPTPSST